MELFKRPDMFYDDYDWTASLGDDPNKTGFPDNILLNRHEGYEMLHFINKAAQILKIDGVF